MRIAIISAPPGNLFVDKLAWTTAGFEGIGCEVRRFHHFSDLGEADDWADAVLFDQYSAGIPGRNIRDAAEGRKAVWVQAWRDLVATDPSKRVVQQEAYFAHGQVMRAMDAVFVKERNRIGEYEASGVRAVYMDCQACPAEIPPCEYADSPEFDVLILGQADRAYAERRSDAASLVAAGYRVLWAGRSNTAAPHGVHGHGWVHPLKDLPALASRCAVALSVDLRCEPGYTSDRAWLLSGVGIPVVARVPEVDSDWGLSALVEVAPQAEVASWIYHDEAGLLACVAQAMDDPAKRQRRGEAARRAVMARHTYRQRAEAIASTVARQ